MTRKTIHGSHGIIPVCKTGFYYCYKCGLVVSRKAEKTIKLLRKPCRNDVGWD
jgi:hypothetical protein